VYGTQLAIHFMRKNKIPGGKIVATASVAAIVPHERYQSRMSHLILVETNCCQLPRVRRSKGGCSKFRSSNCTHSEECELLTESRVEQEINRH
jgi:hypothetical protein